MGISANSENPKLVPAFEEVLESIGSRGKFQMRLNIIFNCVNPCFNMFSVYSFYLAMQTPNHWCHVPGRESSNMSLEEWKNFTIPREDGSFSQCLMYNRSDATNWSIAEPVQCRHGWDYDDTWFSLTVPSQMDWVCDDQHVTKEVLFYAQNIGVALSLLFGYIGDMWFPESPRWLACRGRQEDALLLLRRIAATNGGRVPPFTPQVLRSVARARADRRGFLSLLSSRNVFKNTVLLVCARSAFLMTRFSLVLTSGGQGMNPFLAVALLGAVQVPAYCAVHCAAARVGRRWSAVATTLLAGIACATTSVVLTGNVSGLAMTVMVMVVQFFTTGINAMANLQSVEVHPTCLRQIAACVEWTVAGVAMSAVPYVVFMSDRRMPFAILAAINVGAAFAVSFLPESALQRLPETLQDAAVFGKGQKYWSWRPRPPPEYATK